MSGKLKCDVTKSAKGSILEVKEEPGLGKTIDVIIYEGFIQVNDTIVIGGLVQPIVTKVRALLQPLPLSEMRDKKSKFQGVKQVCAAMGVKIAAPGMDEVIAGMPLMVVGKHDKLDELKEAVQKEIQEVMIETDKEGIIIKADAIGSLEAMITLLRERNIPIRKATVGNISKKDILDAQANEKYPFTRVILGFNVEVANDVQAFVADSGIKVITSQVIYQIIEDYDKWKIEEKKRIEMRALEQLERGAKFSILPNHTFRQSNPAIVGVDITSGVLKTGIALMKHDGVAITHVRSMKSGEDNFNEAKSGTQLAVALDGVTVGRQIHEGDVLYTAISEDHFRKLKEFKDYLSKSEKEVLKEIAEIMRKTNPTWGI